MEREFLIGLMLLTKASGDTYLEKGKVHSLGEKTDLSLVGGKNNLKAETWCALTGV